MSQMKLDLTNLDKPNKRSRSSEEMIDNVLSLGPITKPACLAKNKLHLASKSRSSITKKPVVSRDHWYHSCSSKQKLIFLQNSPS